jgi:hypothetical protein
MIWRKSSFSVNGDACVEVGWRKVAVAVRDSKNTSGPSLAFSTSQWRFFARAVS